MNQKIRALNLEFKKLLTKYKNDDVYRRQKEKVSKNKFIASCSQQGSSIKLIRIPKQ